MSLLGSRGFWRTRKEQGYWHWSYLSPDRFFRPIITFYDRKISKRTKELRDPTYYYHKFHGRKGHQHGRQPNLEMPVTSRENQEYTLSDLGNSSNLIG